MTKIQDLPVAVGLPEDHEYVLPVWNDTKALVTRKISIEEMANRIKDLVIDGKEIEMLTTDSGIQFKKKAKS